MAKIAYKRVSTADQNTARQLAELNIQFDKVFEDKVSGKNRDRPQLQAMLDYGLREGDELYIHSLDRLGRNTKDLIELMDKLKAKGVTVIFVKNNLAFKPDSNNPIDNLMFQMLSAFSQFERELILERQKEGIALAKAKGKYKKDDRKKIDPQVIIDSIVKDKLSFRKTAEKYKVSLSTVQRILKEHQQQNEKN